MKHTEAYLSRRTLIRVRQMYRVVKINLSILLTQFIAAGHANGHEFEDGFIERSVAVVVRDNLARLEYSIGLNPSTRQELINFWQSTGDTAIQSSEGSQATEDVDFLQLAAIHLRHRLVIRVDNQRIDAKLVSALPSSRHHVDVTVALEFELPLAEAGVPIAIEIVDGNFLGITHRQPQVARSVTEKNDPDAVKQQKISCDQGRLLPAPFGGGFRYAFKTAGCAVLSRSNVASILIRADRHLDANYSQAELDIAFKIEAEVAYILRTQTQRQP